MDGLVCDRCGEGLLLNEDVRYTLRVEVRSEYDPMELTAEDLKQDLAKQYEEALAELESISEEEAQCSVYFKGKYDLCLTCQREFLKDPVFQPPK